MNVVPARVRNARDRAAVAHRRLVGHGQGVDIGPQRHRGRARADVAESDVADEPGAGVEALRGKTEIMQVLSDPRGRRDLVSRELRMGMEVAPHLDE